MRNERIEATNLVAKQLFAAEAAIDAAIAETAKLSAIMPEARLRAKIAAMVGQEALTRTSSSLKHLVTAREDMVSAHAALDSAKADIGLRTYAMGGGFPKPEAPTAKLIVVADAA